MISYASNRPSGNQEVRPFTASQQKKKLCCTRLSTWCLHTNKLITQKWHRAREQEPELLWTRIDTSRSVGISAFRLDFIVDLRLGLALDRFLVTLTCCDDAG